MLVRPKPLDGKPASTPSPPRSTTDTSTPPEAQASRTVTRGSPPRVLGHVREGLPYHAVQHQSGVGNQRARVAVDLQRDGDAQRDGGVRDQAREAGRSSSRGIARARRASSTRCRSACGRTRSGRRGWRRRQWWWPSSGRPPAARPGRKGCAPGRHAGHGPAVSAQPARFSFAGLSRGRLLRQQRRGLAAGIQG